MNALANQPVQTVKEKLVCIHTILGKIVELCNEDVELQALWDRVVEVAYRVEFLLDSLMVGDIIDSSSMSFDSISKEIKIAKAEALEICDSRRLDGSRVKEVTKRFNYMPS